MWVSPELAAALRQVEVVDVFQEHSSVVASFQVPDVLLPSEIPWTKVDLHRMGQQAAATPLQGVSSDDWLKDFSRRFEASLCGCIEGLPAAKLPTCSQGRGVRTQPESKTISTVPTQPSRQGEDALKSLRHA